MFFIVFGKVYKRCLHMPFLMLTISVSICLCRYQWLLALQNVESLLYKWIWLRYLTLILLILVNVLITLLQSTKADSPRK